MAFRGDHPFQCSGRCSWAVATDTQDALLTVGVADSEYRDAVSCLAIIDQVNKGPGLKIGKRPVYKLHDIIGAASGRRGTAERLPSPPTRDAACRPAACRPTNSPRTGALDR